MNQPDNLIKDRGRLNLSLLRELESKPEPFTPGEPLFWNDPHIPAEMLHAHLDPNGFAVESLWGNLIGTPYSEASEWIGVVARCVDG